MIDLSEQGSATFYDGGSREDGGLGAEAQGTGYGLDCTARCGVTCMQ